MIAQHVRCRAFVGRKDELAFLIQRYREAADGKGALLLVSGESGVGKTRLVEELEELLTAESHWLVKGNCLQYLRSPYLPILEIMRTLYSAPPVKNQRSKTPGEPPSWLTAQQSSSVPHGETDSLKFSNFDNISNALRTLSRVRPIVVVIEDLQWADLGTGELLLYLATRLQHARVLFIVTFSTTAMTELNPLLPIVVNLERLGAPRIGVEPFTHSEMRAFSQRILEGRIPIPAEMLRKIEELAEGNPYYAEELLCAGLQRRLEGSGDGSDLPASLKGTIIERFRQLSMPERRILEHAAVIGRRFEIEFLARIVQAPLTDVVRTLRRARDLQLITEGEAAPSTYTFRHELTRAVIFNELLAVETLGLHERIATELERVAENRTVELAYHWAAAGNAGKAIHYNERAAAAAGSVYAHGEVAHFLRRALDFAPPGQQRASLCESLAYALYILGEAEESRVWLESAVEQYRALGNREKVAQMLLHVARQRWLDARTTESLELALRALAESRGLSPEIRFTSRVAVARFCALLSMTSESLEHLNAAEKIKGITDPTSIAAFHDVLGIVKGNLGEVDAAVAHFTIATARVTESSNAEAKILAWNNYGYLGSWLGLCDVATTCYDRALTIATEQGYNMRAAFVSLGYARTLMRFGRLAEARTLLDRAISSDIGAPIIRLLLSEIGIPLGVMLDDEGLLNYCARDDSLSLALESGESERLGPVAAAFADYVGARGDTEKAAAILQSALGVLRTADQSWWMLSRVGVYCHAKERTLARDMLLESTRKAPSHIAARACLNLFDAISARRDGDPSHAAVPGLKAAEDFASLHWLPYEAHALEAAGEVDRARSIFESIGDLYDARRLTKSSAPHRGRHSTILTAREKQVADLVVQGRTSKQIAGELGISEHTVVHHLESAYNRFGIRSRAQLAAIMVQAAGNTAAG